MGDWGQANFHRICSWLCQEICDRSGPKTRIAILNTFSGGIDMPTAVIDGEMDLCLATPAGLMSRAITGSGIFRTRALEDLRALAVLPQTDRMVFALDPKYRVRSFADLRRVRPSITIATAPDDGVSFIGYVAARYMEAHGIGAETLRSWGGGYVFDPRPEQALARMEQGEGNTARDLRIECGEYTRRLASRLRRPTARLGFLGLRGSRSQRHGRGCSPPNYLVFDRDPGSDRKAISPHPSGSQSSHVPP